MEGITWRGINSSSMRMVVESLPPISSSKSNKTKLKVDERNGYVSNLNKTFDADVKDVTFHLIDVDIDEVKRWLTGEGEVIFANEPDRYYKAEILNSIEYKEITTGLYKGIVQFDVQPFGYLKEGKEVIILKENAVLENKYDESEPVIKVYGQGEINLVIAQQVVKLKGINDFITLDTTMLEAYKGSELCNRLVNGEFTILPPGAFSVSWSGNVNRVEIIPNWRCL